MCLGHSPSPLCRQRALAAWEAGSSHSSDRCSDSLGGDMIPCITVSHNAKHLFDRSTYFRWLWMTNSLLLPHFNHMLLTDRLLFFSSNRKLMLTLIFFSPFPTLFFPTRENLKPCVTDWIISPNLCPVYDFLVGGLACLDNGMLVMCTSRGLTRTCRYKCASHWAAVRCLGVQLLLHLEPLREQVWEAHSLKHSCTAKPHQALLLHACEHEDETPFITF